MNILYLYSILGSFSEKQCFFGVYQIEIKVLFNGCRNLRGKFHPLVAWGWIYSIILLTQSLKWRQCHVIHFGNSWNIVAPVTTIIFTFQKTKNIVQR